MENQPLDPNEIIDAIGGTGATARIFKIKDSSVSEWRVNGIPQARLMYLRLLRPDLFDAEKSASTTES